MNIKYVRIKKGKYKDSKDNTLVKYAIQFIHNNNNFEIL